MTTALQDAATELVEACGTREDITPLLQGWHVRIELQPVDHDDTVSFLVAAGTVALANGDDGSVRRVTIEAEGGLLTGILEGAVDAAGAYLDGLIEVDGDPEDLVRLDIVVDQLW